MSNAAFSQKLVGVAAEQLEKFGRDTPGITLAVLSSGDGFEVGEIGLVPCLAPLVRVGPRRQLARYFDDAAAHHALTRTACWRG